MVLAHHLIWTLYGWWLPNDPRGSMSRVIASDVLKELGELHYGRKRVQPASKDIRAFYDRARDLLKSPLLTLEAAEVLAVADAFAVAFCSHRYACYACAIMPDHIHILIRKHRDLAEDMILNLQDASRTHVRELGIRKFDHPVWGGPGWKVFLDSVEDIERTIRYIELNPVKARLPEQQWEFVTPYDGWPLRGKR
jgi:REP element-mobilizing transposase RayT